MADTVPDAREIAANEVELWENHGQYRDFLKEGPPRVVIVGRAYLALRDEVERLRRACRLVHDAFSTAPFTADMAWAIRVLAPALTTPDRGDVTHE